MLIFILSYMKNNLLQRVHAAGFNMNQPQANLLIHLLQFFCLKKCFLCTNLKCFRINFNNINAVRMNSKFSLLSTIFFMF